MWPLIIGGITTIRMDNGWIKLHRKFLEWEWYCDSNTMRLFIHLMIRANHKLKSWKGITIKPGQVITGRKKLSEELCLSEQSIRTSLNRLKSTNEITIESTNKYSLITLCNYDSYQSINTETNQQNNQQLNQQLTNKQPTTNHKQECKNDKNERIYEDEKAIFPIDLEKWYTNAIKDDAWLNRFYLDYNIIEGKMKEVLGDYGKAQKRMKQADRLQTYNDWCRHFDLWLRKRKNHAKYQIPI